jgi:pimeloyl-ACP methyl ester carboxylesterase
MPVIEKRGLSFHVQVVGAGKPMVMLHGLIIGSMTTWYFSAAPRLARTHRVTLYDLRGHGRSARPASGYDLATMVEDLDALLDGPATLVGHSWGALIALRLALKRPERVTRLVLVEAPLPPSRAGDIGAFLRLGPAEIRELALNAGIEGMRFLPPAVQQLLIGNRRGTSALLAQVAGLAGTTLVGDVLGEPDIPDEVLGRVRCPTLLVYGERSGYRPVGDRLARALPDARLVVLRGDHWLPMEAPAALTETIAGFCDG